VGGDFQVATGGGFWVAIGDFLIFIISLFYSKLFSVLNSYAKYFIFLLKITARKTSK